MAQKRLLITVVAGVTALALSASSAVAAPAAKVDRGAAALKNCDEQALAALQGKSVKPDKAAKQNRGKHLGQQKPKSESEEVELNGERKQNHGWFVSQAAKDKSLTGRAHGKAVSEVARSDQGKPEQAGD